MFVWNAERMFLYVLIRLIYVQVIVFFIELKAQRFLFSKSLLCIYLCHQKKSSDALANLNSVLSEVAKRHQDLLRQAQRVSR